MRGPGSSLRAALARAVVTREGYRQPEPGVLGSPPTSQKPADA